MPNKQPPPKLLYCRCAYAQTVPQNVKDEVLKCLSDSGSPFEAVADLCEMSARKDPRLKQLAAGGAPLKIAACYPRAVKWLFHSADSPLSDDPEEVEILNMRELSAEEVAAKLELEGRESC